VDRQPVPSLASSSSSEEGVSVGSASSLSKFLDLGGLGSLTLGWTFGWVFCFGWGGDFGLCLGVFLFFFMFQVSCVLGTRCPCRRLWRPPVLLP